MLYRKYAPLLLTLSLMWMTACAAPSTSAVPTAGGPVPGTGPMPARSYDRLPTYFVENRGQTDARVAFYVPGKDNNIYFTPDGLTFAFTSALGPSAVEPLFGASAGPAAPPDPGSADSVASAARRWVVKLDFVGANQGVQPVGEAPTQAVFSYFKGPPSQWRAGLASFAQLRYHNLWPGIDLVYSGQANQLKYEFVVQAGADPAQIQLAYHGASAVRLTADGELEVSTPLNSFRDAAPVAYQWKAGQRIPVEMRFALDAPVAGGQAATRGYSFRLGAYDHSLPLILDPTVLVYSGYIGGEALDFGRAIAVDSAGNAYVTGFTLSTAFPVTVGPDVSFNGNSDAFVAKVNADGTALVYAGYIGGASDDEGAAIAVNSAGEAFITGNIRSSEATFPVTVGPDLTFNDNGCVLPPAPLCGDAFVAKVNAAGTALVYAGYIGGALGDAGNGIAVDHDGNAYVTGNTLSNQTTSPAFPATVGPYLTYAGGTNFGDAFVAKVKADGTGLDYAGYIGGAGDDSGNAIAVDGNGNVFVAGYTDSTENISGKFPVKIGPDLTQNGQGDAFVAEVNAAGTATVFCGYIGGSGTESAKGIALDSGGNAYITGETNSTEATFPHLIGPDLTYNGGAHDAFVAKVNAGGASLAYAGYIGGAGDDYGAGIAIDTGGNAFVVGTTGPSQTGFPVLNGPGLTYNGGSSDAFVTKVNAGGASLTYSGYVGGADLDQGGGIALDSAGAAYITGQTFSDQHTFPVLRGPGLTYGGFADAFVAKVISFVPSSFLYLPLVRR